MRSRQAAGYTRFDLTRGTSFNGLWLRNVETLKRLPRREHLHELVARLLRVTPQAADTMPAALRIS